VTSVNFDSSRRLIRVRNAKINRSTKFANMKESSYKVSRNRNIECPFF
jgi:hypothetical protein